MGENIQDSTQYWHKYTNVEKMNIGLGLGDNIMFFSSKITNQIIKLVFSPGKVFQSSLMLARHSPKVGSWPEKETSNKVGLACLGKTLAHFTHSYIMKVCMTTLSINVNNEKLNSFADYHHVGHPNPGSLF